MTESPAPSRSQAARAAITAALVLCAALLQALFGPALADLVDSYFPPGIIGTGTEVGVTVATRVRPQTDPLGVHVGAFTIRPQIGIGTGYDSNALFGKPARGSPFVTTSGRLDASTNTKEAPLSALVTFEDTRVLAFSRLSHTDWTASLGKVFTFGTDRLTVTGTHLALHQTGRDLNTPALDAPGAYSVDNFRISYSADRGPFYIEPQLQYTAYRYADVFVGGLRSAQGFRDREILDGQLTLKYGYALLRNFAVVLRGASIRYDSAAPGQFRPDATSFTALAGIDHASSAVWRFRLLAGVQTRHGESPAVKSRTAPVGEGSVTFMPSGLTTIGLTVTRALQDSAGEFAAAYTYTEARLAIDHELTRDILLHGDVAVQRAEYDQGGGSETIGSASAAVTWLVNRNARVTGSYAYLSKKPATGGAIAESVAMIRLQLGL